MYYIGIDLGTSACKFLLVDGAGTVCRTVSRDYPLYFPQPGWSEQNPQDWWTACMSGIPQLLEGVDPAQVAGIGVGGQMHGLVALDDQGQVLRPAILWNDGRTAPQVDWLNHQVGREVLSRHTANIAFAGFTAPKLLWMAQNEPDLFARIHKILLPKDYLVYCLTGAYATDYSDASGTLLLDVEHKTWSREMLELCHLREDQMPTLHESWERVGALRGDVARALGLSPNTLVCAGAAAGLLWSWGYGVLFLAPARALAGTYAGLTGAVAGWPYETAYGAAVDVRVEPASGPAFLARLYGEPELLEAVPGDQISATAACRTSEVVRGQLSGDYTAQGIFLTASCSGAAQPTVKKSWTFLARSMISSGAMMYPSRQPVME